MSYSSKDREAADEIDNDLKALGVNLVRDVRDIGYRQSIRAFMNQIRSADFVLILVSNDFLRSRNCMYEVLELLKDETFKERLLPVVLPSARISSTGEIAGYIRFWETESKDLRARASGLDLKNAGVVSEELRIVDSICQTVGDFCTVVRDMLYRTIEGLKETGYSDILAAIGYDVRYVVDELLRIAGLGDPEEQDMALDELLLQFPRNANVHFLKAYIEGLRENHKKELKSYSDSISIQPGHVGAYQNRAAAFSRLGCIDEAIRDCTAIIVLSPGSPDGYFLLGLCFMKKEWYDKAAGQFTMALERRPTHAAAYGSRGSAHHRTGRFQEALRDYNTAIGIDDTDHTVHFNMGLTFYTVKEYQKAIECFSISDDLKSDSEEVLLHRGASLLHSGITIVR